MSENSSPIPSRPFSIPSDPSHIDKLSVDSGRIDPSQRSHHHHHRMHLPPDLMRQLLLYQFGIFLSQLPRYILAQVFENSPEHFKPLTDKEFALLKKFPEKIREEALKILRLDGSLNDLKKAENPFKDLKGNLKEKFSLEGMIFEKIQHDMDRVKQEKKNKEEPNYAKNLPESEDISKEQLVEKQILNKNEKNTEKNSLGKNVKNNDGIKPLKNLDEATLAKELKESQLNNKKESSLKEEASGKAFSSNTKENPGLKKTLGQELKSREERSLQKETEKAKDKNSEKTSIPGEARLSEPKNYSSKLNFDPLKNQTQAQVEKGNQAFVKGEGANQTNDARAFVPNTAALVVPYFLQEKVKALLYKTQKFKFKKVVKKEKNPSHEKPDDELNYPTIDDIS